MKIQVKINPNLYDVGKFVLAMKQFKSEIDLYKGSKYVDAKVIQDVLSVDTSSGCEIELLSNDSDEIRVFNKIIDKWRDK